MASAHSPNGMVSVSPAFTSALGFSTRLPFSRTWPVATTFCAKLRDFVSRRCQSNLSIRNVCNAKLNRPFFPSTPPIAAQVQMARQGAIWSALLVPQIEVFVRPLACRLV